VATIVLAGGGTGGHVYPALAIGDELKRRGHEVLYYGDAGRLEAKIAPERGYRFRAVQAMQYPRGGVLGKIQFAFALLRSVAATRPLLKEDHVDLVLGVGGYISAPPVLAGWTLGLKRVVHEANAYPGLANQLCARVAQQVLLTWEASRRHIPGGAPKDLVGVPVNLAVLTGDRAEAAAKYGLDPRKPTVVFVGGSLGAARLNELAMAAAKDPARSYQIVHITGQRYHAEIIAAYGAVPEGVSVRDYESRVADAYAMADLVVCRAGSATLAELCAVGRPGLLIPSPNVTENHQEENARGLVEGGAARLLVEKDWDIEKSVGVVREMMADAPKLAAMGIAAKGLARLDAATRAADLVEKVLKG
jgi:UDP-N-acetylglucosamine--N-acetylmuramyl-(pentapeptide) pyrophosphoryl-undecaprenol N-acetylglucosamine transferase